MLLSSKEDTKHAWPSHILNREQHMTCASKDTRLTLVEKFGHGQNNINLSTIRRHVNDLLYCSYTYRSQATTNNVLQESYCV